MEGVSEPTVKSEKDSILVSTEHEGKRTHSSVNSQENIICRDESPQTKDEPEEISDCIKKEMKDEVEVGLEEWKESEAEDRDHFPGSMKGDLTETSQISLAHAGLPEVFQKIKVETQGDAEFDDSALEPPLCAPERENIKPDEEEWHQVTSDHQSSGLRSETIFGKECGCGKDPVVRLSPEKIISLHQNLRNFEGPEENLRRKFGCEREAVVELARLSLDMMGPLQGINSKGKLEHTMKDTGMPDPNAKSLSEELTVAEGLRNHLNNKGGLTELRVFFPVRDICDQSSVKTVDENDLNQDSPINSREPQLPYNHCSYVASNEGDMNASCVSPNKEKKFACAQCSFKTNSKQYLMRHHLIHNKEKKFACAQCSFKTTNKRYLRRHHLSHSKEKRFACAQCSFRTNSKPYLKEHRLVHSKDKKFACEQCSYKTNYRKSFHVHCLNHSSIKKFACDQCSFKTNDKENMTRHFLIHSNIKKFSCDQCSYKTNAKSDLTQHCLNHSNLKKFACEQCSYKTNSKSNFTQHRLNHSNFKKFACEQCSYKTNYKHDFTQHCLNHSNFKRFACDQCSYETNKKSNLTRHCLTHAVFEKIVCD